jgi:hypothetical protein
VYPLRRYSLSLESVTVPSTTYPLPRERASVVVVLLTVSFLLSLPSSLSTTQSVNSKETADLEDPNPLVDDPTVAALEAALANIHAGNSYISPFGYTLRFQSPALEATHAPLPFP